ncbi:hypothetical protein SODALDRAFT_360191 [Sodiomyces alkalinus F11]|uniref:Integral membrane protein n=1 Tax=Sodiomyces alkalinus (strain CBS 110278 / VKM F-3762 / F11) TaxID=1314773 RepID=A0A3N2PTS4_SODAK|nr:hypothetical protein SODALDRAFT_360191 [Sodiomyces alkalinus F11]ROT37898.1 hypothetical protein SODALDRAFT_360191 [Sodiomyces alkalinus F11]
MGAHASGNDDGKPDADSYPPTYFALADHAGVMFAHIALMAVAWVFLLPVAVMLSLARSRHTLALQFVFLAVNALGVLLSVVYNAKTPDLYPSNAHHKVGWVATWVITAQILVGLLGRVAGRWRRDPVAGGFGNAAEHHAFIPVSAASVEEQRRLDEMRFSSPYRQSNDSGQGTEPNTESLRSDSASGRTSPRFSDARKEYVDVEDVGDGFPMPMPSGNGGPSILGRVSSLLSSRVWRGLMFAYDILDRIILLLGFIAFCLGIITYGRLFEGHGVFSGLAHWIKGGVFFWFGILTLGRWSGSFGELGWAWNVRPNQAKRKWRPSAEFIESFSIFFYGATNVMLEHLGNWGGEWGSRDLDHLSIPILFIGGGLLGMLVESTRVRDLLHTTVSEAALTAPKPPYDQEEGHDSSLQPPKQYGFSTNPIPALVILLLGFMMSAHEQGSMVSSMLHTQWGELVAGAAVARGLTYFLLYLKPPQSVLPSRPPTELLTSFGLIAGSIILMASSSDTVEGMIHYNLNGMFMYNFTMGFVGVLMAWVIIVLAIKGWAVRKETRGRFNMSH